MLFKVKVGKAPLQGLEIIFFLEMREGLSVVKFFVLHDNQKEKKNNSAYVSYSTHGAEIFSGF